MAYASLLMKNISNWDDFHAASRVAFGFPSFYGNNGDAWIDCLSYLDQNNGMSAFVLAHDETLEVLLADFGQFAEDFPEIAIGVTQLFAAVNARYLERDDFLRLRLVLT
tara:strand:+ start:269 stop:595 length:327 start_codon:yes stop_codon:yes gene_type:complete